MSGNLHQENAGIRLKTKRKRLKGKQVLLTGMVLILLAVISVCCYFSAEITSYNKAVNDYNLAAEEYQKLAGRTSIENIDGMKKKIVKKDLLEEGLGGFIHAIQKGYKPFSMKDKTEQVKSEMDDLLSEYRVMQQITSPKEVWVMERLRLVEDLTGMQAVTKDHDPNGHLGTDGGYTSCIYFSVSDIDSDKAAGEDLVDKGTDAGGAVEVYDSLKDADNRCEYLGQFDHTLLYSGSYAIVGTMVVRTSYALSDERQVQITDRITRALTELK